MEFKPEFTANDEVTSAPKFVAEPGEYHTLGACYDGKGTNFALYSSTAVHVYIELYDQQETNLGRYALTLGESFIWHAYFDGVGPEHLYVYFVDGAFSPEQGKWHNIENALIDPYAKKLVGQFSWVCAQGQSFLSQKKQPQIPKNGIVLDRKYRGTRPNIPWHETIIYECHVKGATKNFPGIPASIQGCYSAVGHPVFIKHLLALGVTTIELMPVHYFIDEEGLAEQGLSNYWGYNPINFFTPHPVFAQGNAIAEFKSMVAALHEAGMEVLIDVVYNHTAEGSNLGPTLCYRGIDNKAYYRLHKSTPREYINDTGCGNTVSASSGVALRLILDSLRYWVEYMGVDGFRFDLATILGRSYRGFSNRHTFFRMLAQDPVLNRVKLIAEPWDIGPGGYQLGAFPRPWREWNDQYRDNIRRFWNCLDGELPLLAKHIHGSDYLYDYQRKPVTTGINYISSHDGFTLADIVTYQNKHNEANNERNRDGHNENYTNNWGEEGKSDHPCLIQQRLKMQKNFLLTLLLSQGVPMIGAGTEVANSQSGNNNAYCQDNDIGWVNWPKQPQKHPLYQFFTQALALRKQFRIFSHDKFIHEGDTDFQVQWFGYQGQPMSNEDWHCTTNQFLGYLVIDKHKLNTLLILLNAGKEGYKFVLPASQTRSVWQQVIDTNTQSHQPTLFMSGAKVLVASHSSMVFTS